MSRGAWGGGSSRGGVHLKRSVPLPGLSPACGVCGLPTWEVPAESPAGFLIPGEKVLRCASGHRSPVAKHAADPAERAR